MMIGAVMEAHSWRLGLQRGNSFRRPSCVLVEGTSMSWRSAFWQPVSWCELPTVILFKLVSSWQFHVRVCAASIN